MKNSDFKMQRLSMELEKKKTAPTEIREKGLGTLCPSSRCAVKE